MEPLWSAHATPLYEQVKAAVRERLAAGEWPPGSPLPGERRLMGLFGVSRPTVRQAIADLVAEGLLQRRPGRGTFVAPQPPAPRVVQLLGFAEELERAGLNPVIRVLRAEVVSPPEEARRDLGLGADHLALLVERVVATAEGPVFVDRTVLPEAIGRPLLAFGLEGSIYRLLEHLGVRLQQGEERVAAVAAGPWEARLLEVVPGTPLLRVHRVTSGEDGRPVETSLAWYRSDRYELRPRMRRAAG